MDQIRALAAMLVGLAPRDRFAAAQRLLPQMRAIQRKQRAETRAERVAAGTTREQQRRKAPDRARAAPSRERPGRGRLTNDRTQ